MRRRTPRPLVATRQHHPAGATRSIGRRLRRDTVGAVALVFLVLLTLAAVLAPIVAPYDPSEIVGMPTQWPTLSHLLGTDEVGRDILSRLIYGARASLTVGLLSPVLAMLVGLPWGLVSGFMGGIVDTVSMRLTDGLLAFPGIILALAAVAVLGPSVRNVTIAIGVVYIPQFARVARAEALRVKQADYVAASVVAGGTDFFVIRRAVLPNVVPIVTVQFTLVFATAVLTEAALSFLGLGVQPPTPSWGSMLGASRNYLASYPLYSVLTGAAIFLTVLCMSLLGDSLRDLIDPRRRRQP